MSYSFGAAPAFTPPRLCDPGSIATWIEGKMQCVRDVPCAPGEKRILDIDALAYVCEPAAPPTPPPAAPPPAGPPAAEPKGAAAMPIGGAAVVGVLALGVVAWWLVSK